MNTVIIGGRYQHYKGREYIVLMIALHSETREEMVVYQGQYEDAEFGNTPIWVRPLSMFIEEVDVDGERRPRFTLLKESE